MSQEALPRAAQDAQGTADIPSTRVPVRGTWLIRAAAVVYLIVAGLITYAVLFAA